MYYTSGTETVAKGFYIYTMLQILFYEGKMVYSKSDWIRWNIWAGVGSRKEPRQARIGVMSQTEVRDRRQMRTGGYETGGNLGVGGRKELGVGNIKDTPA